MPLKSAPRDPEGGLRFLEEKLSVYVQGAAGHPPRRRNPALDLLTGRVPDERLQPPAAAGETPAWQVQASAAASRALPRTLVIPRAAMAMAPAAASQAAVGHRASLSPWLQPSSSMSVAAPRIRFDASVPRAVAPWWLGRRLIAPVVAGLMLVAGISVVRELAEPGETIVVRAPSRATVQAEPTSTPLAPLVMPPKSELAPAPISPTVAAPSPVPSDQLSVLLDERFGSNARGWPDNPNGASWLSDGAYHLFARQTARFVAVRVPGAHDLGDVVVSGRFRKTGGPAGGGYGLMVRDQVVDRGDGQSQAGPFYVFEVGDKGELGVWLRQGDRWLDLLPWTASDAIRPGGEANELTVSAIGDRLSFLVNGIPVATQLDTVLHHGGVGIFTGGDGNQVTLERLTVRTPR